MKINVSCSADINIVKNYQWKCETSIQQQCELQTWTNKAMLPLIKALQRRSWGEMYNWRRTRNKLFSPWIHEGCDQYRMHEQCSIHSVWRVRGHQDNKLREDFCPWCGTNSHWPAGQLAKSGGHCLQVGLKRAWPWLLWQPSDGYSLGHLSQELQLSLTLVQLLLVDTSGLIPHPNSL